MGFWKSIKLRTEKNVFLPITKTMLLNRTKIRSKSINISAQYFFVVTKRFEKNANE